MPTPHEPDAQGRGRPNESMHPTAGRRAQIEAVFDAALERTGAERADWLAARCGDDHALRSEVESLLAAHERTAGLLDEPRAAAAAVALVPHPDSGRQIGPYRVLRELGRGGMGVVYLAERNDGQFRRQVAVKLLRASGDADELHRRFLTERQILASLSHPNIAQLLDGGVAEGQLPYLAIEYVDGLPITEYCARNRLDIDARLRLFQDVCAAVHHAHRNLVLHRDLKPGNVLVTTSGQVKLLDFGIAKILNPSLFGTEQPVTRTAFRVMTPAYASPEQVRGEALTTASDVYALGLVLYELLTGHRPHDITADDAPGAMVEAICEREPERPSSRVVRSPAPATVATERDTTPERLRRRLQGDLDAITMMALRKEPGRRYGSAELLAADVARHLDGLPVLAHRGSQWYRARKFLGRHRAAAAGAALAVLTLLIGASAAAWQAGIAAHERDRAERALDESREVTGFLLGLFEGSDPAAPAGAATTARDLLQRGADRAAELAGQPHVQARMFGVLGRVHLSLGDLDDAQRFGERMLTLRVAELGAWHADVAQPLALLADVARRRGQFDSAHTLLVRAADVQARSLGPESAERGATLHDLAALEVQRGDLARAEQLAREAHSARSTALGPSDPLTVETLALLASVLRGRGNGRGAEAMLREAIHLRERETGTRSSTASSDDLLQLAELLGADSARAPEAERLFRQVAERERMAARPDQRRAAGALDGLARLLERRGAIDDAERALREIVALRERAYGPDHSSVSGSLAHLGGLLRRAGRLDAAEETYRRMADIDRRTLGADHPTYAGTLTALAVLLTERGRFAPADSLLQAAMHIRRTRLGPEHMLVAKTLRRQGELRIRERRFAEADSILRRALEIVLTQRQPAAPDVREMHGTLAELYEAWGRPEESARHRRLASAASAGD